MSCSARGLSIAASSASRRGCCLLRRLLDRRLLGLRGYHDVLGHDAGLTARRHDDLTTYDRRVAAGAIQAAGTGSGSTARIAGRRTARVAHGRTHRSTTRRRVTAAAVMVMPPTSLGIPTRGHGGNAGERTDQTNHDLVSHCRNLSRISGSRAGRTKAACPEARKIRNGRRQQQNLAHSAGNHCWTFRLGQAVLAGRPGREGLPARPGLFQPAWQDFPRFQLPAGRT